MQRVAYFIFQSFRRKNFRRWDNSGSLARTSSDDERVSSTKDASFRIFSVAKSILSISMRLHARLQISTAWLGQLFAARSRRAARIASILLKFAL
jgi:hypothetical protein